MTVGTNTCNHSKKGNSHLTLMVMVVELVNDGDGGRIGDGSGYGDNRIK